MHGVLNDVRHGWRSLRRHPAFAAAAVSTIALAIASNTIVFALVNGVLLRPLRLPDARSVLRLEERHEGRPVNLTGATLQDVAARSRTLAYVAGYRLSSAALTSGTDPIRVASATVTPAYLRVLGVVPRAGRVFEPRDFTEGSRAVLIRERLWTTAFGRDEHLLGRAIALNARSLDVVGILPESVFYPGDPDVFLPFDEHDAMFGNRRAHLFTTIARLAPSASLASAKTELAALSAALTTDSGRTDGTIELVASTLGERLTRSARPAMVIVWAAVGLLLLIACANVAGLLLARGTARQRDLAIRAALGCGELRLMRYLAIESVLLGAIGGSIGTALGASAIPVLKGLLPASLPRAADVTVDWRVLAAGAVLSVVMALLFGMLPSLRAARAPATGALRTRDAMEKSSLLRTTTVGAQIAITLVLLVGAALASRSMLKAASVPPGFNPDDVLTVDLSLPSARYPEVDDHRRFYAAVLDRVSAGAGVTAAAVTGTLPLGGSPATDFTAEGSPPRDAVTADIVPATPAYFRAMEIQVVAGRTFSASDRDGGPPVAIVSESAARALWPGMNPLGRRFTMHDWGEPYDATVVGIVADVHQNGLDAAPSSSVYYPFAQFPHTTLSNSIVIRHSGNLAAATAAVRSAIRGADPEQPITRVAAFTDILSRSLAERRFNALLVTVFGLMALALSVVGLYGLVAYLLQSRRREIAVRVALGASPSRIVRLALLLAGRPVCAGMVAGLVAAAWAARAAQSLLFGVTAGDPASFAAAVAIVAGAAAAALAVPLFRALGADPVSGLRAD